MSGLQVLLPDTSVDDDLLSSSNQLASAESSAVPMCRAKNMVTMVIWRKKVIPANDGSIMESLEQKIPGKGRDSLYRRLGSPGASRKFASKPFQLRSSRPRRERVYRHEGFLDKTPTLGKVLGGEVDRRTL